MTLSNTKKSVQSWDDDAHPMADMVNAKVQSKALRAFMVRLTRLIALMLDSVLTGIP